MAKIYYDKKYKRLVMFGEKATPDFWDKQWQADDFKNRVEEASKIDLVERETKLFLKPGKAKILEGGCGDGHFVLSLSRAGYDCIGVDYAQKTIEKIKQALPSLKVCLGDLRSLPFSENSFDGYWSLGVIEHFYNGYDDVLKEMKKVIKPSGYLFLTFPAMNPIRKIKAKLGIYPNYNEETVNLDEFYQFFLEPNEVIKKFEKNGFELRSKKFVNGSGGINRDLVKFKNKKINRLVKKIGKIFSFFFGHSALLVLRVKDNE